jgi:hypothetical protein
VILAAWGYRAEHWTNHNWFSMSLWWGRSRTSPWVSYTLSRDWDGDACEMHS